MSLKLARLLPVTSRHVGVWDGMFRRVDADGIIVASFRSRVIFRLLDDAHWPAIYRQTNSYFAPDGSVMQSFDTEGSFVGDRIRYESDRVRGWAADDPLDEYGANSLLFMDILYRPGERVYEMAQISECGQYRTRTVQFLKDGRTMQRTLIDETLLTRDWQAFDAGQPLG